MIHPATLKLLLKGHEKAYPAYPETQLIDTTNLPLISNSTDIIFVILSAHEIEAKLRESLSLMNFVET